MVLSHSTWSITPKKVLRWVLRTGSEFSFDIGKWACDPSSIYIYSYRRQTGEWGKMSIDIHVILSCRALHDVPKATATADRPVLDASRRRCAAPTACWPIR